jgi:hypothetical protein
MTESPGGAGLWAGPLHMLTMRDIHTLTVALARQLRPS